MALIEYMDGVTLEINSEIKRDSTIIRTKSPILKGELFIKIKNEPLIKSEPVEIGIDDIRNSSDEEHIDHNYYLKKNQKVLSHRTENISNININEIKVDADRKPNNEGKDEHKEFNAADNLASDEELVINFGANFPNIENRSRKSIRKDKIDWAEAYKTCELTNCEEDLKKVIVHRPSKITQSVAPHEYTSVALNKLVCNYCQQACKNIKYMRIHVRRMHRKVTTIYQCPYCPYKAKFQLKSHIILKHKDEKNIHWFECYKCNAKFKLKFHMAKHIKNHSTMEELQDVLHTCSICGKKFRNNGGLTRHKKFVHDKDPHKITKCQECEFTCTSITVMKHHVEVYHRDLGQLSTYKCKDCDYQTKYQFRFQIHSNLHRKPRSCEKCGFVTNLVGTLKLHQMTHKKHIDESELKYRCSKCDYKTYRLYSLNVHMLNHLKPDEIQYFYCYHCKFKAKRKDNLKTHILRHFKKEEIPFHCFICDFTSNVKPLLIKHISEHSTAQSLPQVSQ